MKVITIVLFIFFMLTVKATRAEEVKNKEVVKWAAGVSSDSSLLRLDQPAVSGLYFLGADSLVQGSIVVASSDPNVMSFGGYYKKNLYGTMLNGFHFGVGYGTGSFDTDRSFWRLSGVGGLHFLVARRVYISFDAGLTMGKDLDPSDDFFQIGGNSSLLGLSVFWLL